MKKLASVTFLTAALIGLGMVPAMALPSACDGIPGNLVTNCGFETGNTTGWTFTPASSGSDFLVGPSPIAPHSGTFAAQFGAVGTLDDALTQTLTTTPGTQYSLSFWLAHNSTNSANDFNVSWNGAPLLTLLNTSAFDYTLHTFTVTGTGSDTLGFAGREVPAWYALDDVSVTSPVPEPSTLVLLTSSLGSLGLGLLRRRKAA